MSFSKRADDIDCFILVFAFCFSLSLDWLAEPEASGLVTRLTVIQLFSSRSSDSFSAIQLTRIKFSGLTLHQRVSARFVSSWMRSFRVFCKLQILTGNNYEWIRCCVLPTLFLHLIFMTFRFHAENAFER